MKNFGKILVGLLLLGGLLWLADTSLRGYYLRLVVLVGVTSIIALGVNVTNGYTNIFSLGFGGTMMVAAYTTALSHRCPFPTKKRCFTFHPGWRGFSWLFPWRLF